MCKEVKVLSTISAQNTKSSANLKKYASLGERLRTLLFRLYGRGRVYCIQDNNLLFPELFTMTISKFSPKYNKHKQYLKSIYIYLHLNSLFMEYITFWHISV